MRASKPPATMRYMPVARASVSLGALAAVLRVPASMLTGAVIAADVVSDAAELALAGGETARVGGPASTPVGGPAATPGIDPSGSESGDRRTSAGIASAPTRNAVHTAISTLDLRTRRPHMTTIRNTPRPRLRNAESRSRPTSLRSLTSEQALPFELHSSRYEEVSKRVNLGQNVEGRDERGIKKTLCALLKILHPIDAPSDEEFDEYVAYAVECRRRVKEQMNKRKPDDEFAMIELPFVNREGKEVVDTCPESVGAQATLEPARRKLRTRTEAATGAAAPGSKAAGGGSSEPPTLPTAAQPTVAAFGPKEWHYTIVYGDTGHSYDSIFGPYLAGAKSIVVEDPYIRLSHQIANFVRFCETVVKADTVQRISLVTSYDEQTDMAALKEKLDDLKQSLLEHDVALDVRLDGKLHDREVRLDNGWTVKIGRGLDFYQKPDSWSAVGATDLSLRRCLETKVDVFATPS